MLRPQLAPWPVRAHALVMATATAMTTNDAAFEAEMAVFRAEIEAEAALLDDDGTEPDLYDALWLLDVG
jgi:hypothetical protein